jgi:anti-sigma regulatory factor (Ser/Thr protein kinase)
MEKNIKMNDWKSELSLFRNQLNSSKNVIVIRIPNHFIFRNHGVYIFDPIINFFDWSITGEQVIIDFTLCKTANYQALSLVVLYCWKLKHQGCRISFELSEDGASNIWRWMGASGLFHVSTDEKSNFRHNDFKPLLAIRNSKDFKKAIRTAEDYTNDFNVEYQSTLRHVISELLYNTMEHGKSFFLYRGKQLVTPSLIQFTWYQRNNEIHFIIADTGIGIKNHLSQTYKGIESDLDAIKLAIKPQISGTFGSSNPYESKNNAGVGLYISTNIIKKLKADMHIISGNGVLHISPRDVTGQTMETSWPGTIVLVSIKLENGVDFAFHAMMQEFRDAALSELKKGTERENDGKYYLSIDNYFGPFAEDKQAAIKVRDERILHEIALGKKIVIDFEHVKSAPHSFLSALLATPIKRTGMKAYKTISIINANPEIRETIDYIMDENTE